MRLVGEPALSERIKFDAARACRAERIASIEVGISRRDLNETTSLGSATTVTKALRGLSEAGLIKRILGDPDGTAASHGTSPHRIGRPPARYRLLLPPELEDATALTATQPQEGSEAFMNRAGYGQQVGLTYLEVRRRGSVSQDQLARERRLTARTIRRHLARLEALGLVQQASGQWSATNVSPKDVVPLEVVERKAAMGVRHELEREAYQSRLRDGHE